MKSSHLLLSLAVAFVGVGAHAAEKEKGLNDKFNDVAKDVDKNGPTGSGWGGNKNAEKTPKEKEKDKKDAAKK